MSEFGRDTSCTDSIRAGQSVTGVRLVAEAAYRRLTTPRGMLRGAEEEQNYGFDLTELIGSVSTDSDKAALEGRVRNELLKDDRILEAVVTAVVIQSGPAADFNITIVGETKEGPFDLVLAVSEVTIELLGISAEET